MADSKLALLDGLHPDHQRLLDVSACAQDVPVPAPESRSSKPRRLATISLKGIKTIIPASELSLSEDESTPAPRLQSLSDDREIKKIYIRRQGRKPKYGRTGRMTAQHYFCPKTKRIKSYRLVYVHEGDSDSEDSE